jgi:hypothetical protein
MCRCCLTIRTETGEVMRFLIGSQREPPESNSENSVQAGGSEYIDEVFSHNKLFRWGGAKRLML